VSYATEWFWGWYGGERAERHLVTFLFTGPYAPLYYGQLLFNVRDTPESALLYRVAGPGRVTRLGRVARPSANTSVSDDLERISGPAGLDIGADSPAETALSMLAEALALRAGRPGGRLQDSPHRIHAEPVAGKK